MKSENLMQPFGSGDFHKGHFIEKNKTIRTCLDNIKFEDYNISIPKDYIDVFPYDSAWDLLKGSCDLFAKALYQRFGFTVYELKYKDKLVHCYCKLLYYGKEVYIDVRGATTNKREFFSEFGTGEESICEDIENKNLNDEWAKEGFAFANEIITKYHNYYAFD